MHQKKIIQILTISTLLFPFAAPAFAANDCGDAIMMSIAGKTLGLQSLEILPPEDYAYSIIDGSVSPQQFTWIRPKIRNKITCAALNSGTLTAYALFRERTDYDPDLLNDPPAPESRAAGYSHRTSVSLDVVQFSAGGEMELVFDFRENPIPAGITDLVLAVVYQGTFGSDAKPIVAQGTKDLNEPHHLAIFNDTDRIFCSGPPASVMTHSEFLASPCVGCDDDDPMYSAPWDDLVVYVTLAPDAEIGDTWLAAIDPLPAATFSKLIFFAEGQNFFVHQWNGSDLAQRSFYSVAPIEGVVNQQGDDGSWAATPVAQGRGILTHGGVSVNVVCGTATDVDQSLWPSLSGQAALPLTSIYNPYVGP